MRGQQKLLQFLTHYLQLDNERVVLIVLHVMGKGQHVVVATEDGNGKVVVGEQMEGRAIAR